MFSFGGPDSGHHSIRFTKDWILAHRPTINELVQHDSRSDAIME